MSKGRGTLKLKDNNMKFKAAPRPSGIYLSPTRTVVRILEFLLGVRLNFEVPHDNA
jgi:hypothetical protein